MKLSHPSLAAKLVTLLAIPAIGLAVLGFREFRLRWAERQEAVRIGGLVELSVRIGAAAHRLQIERGSSALFIGSQGRSFGEELKAARAQTDGAVAELLAHVKSAQGLGGLPGVSEALGKAGQQTEGLPAARQGVDALKLPGPESFAYYTRAIGGWLAVVSDLPKHSEEAGLARRLGAYTLLLKAKELAGQERATASGAIARGEFDAAVYTRWVGLVAGQQQLLEQCLESGDPALRSGVETLEQGARNQEVQKVRAQIQGRGPGKCEGLDAPAWFKTSTARIDAMQEVEIQAAGGLRTSVAAAQSRSTQALVISAVAGGGILLFLGVAGTGVIRSIRTPVKRLAEQLAAGAHETIGAASQIASTSQSLAEGASEQAASLEETSASLEEMSSMTKRNAEGASLAKALAGETRKAVEAGTIEIQTMNQAMAAIQTASNGIAAIIKTIDEIAFQTNLLALNAAVEAARAGQAGQGFAVVADEVRTLAMRSAGAARETADKIADSIAKSQTGVQASAKVSARLEEIAQKVHKMDECVAEIAAASHEQSEGIRQVNIAVSEMDRVTQSNASASEEAAAASEELHAQAQGLEEMVGELTRVVTGGDEAAPARPPARPTAPTRRTSQTSPTRPAAPAYRPMLL